MAKQTLSVKTPHGEFLRTTDNPYTVVAVVQMAHNREPWAIWSRDLGKVQKNVQRLRRATVYGFYSVSDGSLVAPGTTVAVERRVRQTEPKLEPVHEFERCSECDRRHDPARQRCGNCWRCHEPSVPCKVTKSEITASIERHASAPNIYRVLTREWRPFDQVTVPQCDCHKGN
jgi:hypothetical protein